MDLKSTWEFNTNIQADSLSILYASQVAPRD